MPLFHIGGTGWALCGMSRGGHSVILRDMDPAAVLRIIEEHRITEAFVVPAVLMFLLATPELATADVSSLRTVFYGASPISEDVLVRSMGALGMRLRPGLRPHRDDRGHHLAACPPTTTPTAPGPTCCGRPGDPSTTSSCGSSTPGPGETLPGGRGGRGVDPIGPEHARLLEQARGDGGRPLATTAGSAPATPAGWTRRGTCSSTTASRT